MLEDWSALTTISPVVERLIEPVPVSAPLISRLALEASVMAPPALLPSSTCKSVSLLMNTPLLTVLVKWSDAGVLLSSQTLRGKALVPMPVAAVRWMLLPSTSRSDASRVLVMAPVAAVRRTVPSPVGCGARTKSVNTRLSWAVTVMSPSETMPLRLNELTSDTLRAPPCPAAADTLALSEPKSLPELVKSISPPETTSRVLPGTKIVVDANCVRLPPTVTSRPGAETLPSAKASRSTKAAAPVETRATEPNWL